VKILFTDEIFPGQDPKQSIVLKIEQK